MAAIALAKFGSMARAKIFMPWFVSQFPRRAINPMASIHSNKVAMWINQVTRESACTQPTKIQAYLLMIN